MQYPKCNELSFSFSYGKITSLEDNQILHNASTDNGSSGAPIIRRCKDNYIIGLHYGGIQKENNFATIFDSILNDINKNCINCIYIKKDNENEIQLLYDYSNEDFKYSDEETYKYIEDENEKLQYLEAKELNKKIYEDYMELYINEKKVKFNYKYKDRENKEIKVKFKFKKTVNNMSHMFYDCSSIVSIDLSSFNTNKVTNMSHLFYGCSSLASIDLTSFYTNKVTNMNHLFYGCSSLVSIDLSSFNTNNVNNMKGMFCDCSSLKSINLSSFNTDKVTNMSYMFSYCSSLESLDLTSFNTNKVTNMRSMFENCTSLKLLDISSFNTDKVTNMMGMFIFCSSLESLDLSLFNTKNAIMYRIFTSCPIKTIKINNKKDPILKFVHKDTIIK